MHDWSINLAKVKTPELQVPFGYTRDQLPETKERSNVHQKNLLEKKLVDVATSNKSQIFMTGFMMWMIGNSINIFMIFFVFQGLSSSIKALFDVNKVFQPYNTLCDSLLKYKLLYLLVNLVVLGIILYKLMNIGLLPTSPSDWIDLIPPYSQNIVAIQS